MGSDFALFNSKYNKRIIVSNQISFYNGGSGNLLIYEKIIKRIKKLYKDLKIISIIGPYCNNQKFVSIFNNFSNIKIIKSPKNISEILNGTRLFISPRHINVESSFLRTPSLLVKMNDKQNLPDLFMRS